MSQLAETQPEILLESSVYRLLKAHDLIPSPAFIVIKAADVFTDKTTAPNQLWQTDFTYLKVTGWGWYYLSTAGRRLLRQRPNHPPGTRKDQTRHHQTATIATSVAA